MSNSSARVYTATQQLFAGKIMLAPMVRIGSLPMRLLSLEMGADLVYSEETIDKKIIGSTRTLNASLGTVDFVRNGRVVFRTHPAERDRLVMQLGTADPDLALQAALVVADDVLSIDVNCGCPVHFSVHAGMGAALMRTPDLLERILVNLVQNSGKPVTCKIRIFDNLDETLALCRRLERTGISALGVHCRTVKERPRERGHWDVFPHIVRALSVPVIVNGDVFTRADIDSVLDMSGASSVMLARGAQANPSIFRREGLLPVHEVVSRYLELCVDMGAPYQCPKYAICSMWPDLYDDIGRAMRAAKCMRDVCVAFDMDAYYASAVERQLAREEAVKAKQLDVRDCQKNNEDDDAAAVDHSDTEEFVVKRIQLPTTN